MPDFPLIGVQRYTTEGADTSNTSGQTLTANASANTEGSYSQIAASVTEPWTGFWVFLFDPSNTNRDFLVDVAIGAAASEQEIVSDLLFSVAAATGFTTAPYFCPLAIPAGVRLAARCRSSVGSSTIEVIVIGFRGTLMHGLAPLGRCGTYGQNTADSGGTPVDAGGTANTEGAWAQLSASTTYPIRQLMLGFGNAGDNTRTSANYLLDIGIGSAGNEVALINDLPLVCDSGPDMVAPRTLGPFMLDIPAGTRLVARVRSSTNTAGDRTLDVIAYGFS
jgi:hypothetical protein